MSSGRDALGDTGDDAEGPAGGNETVERRSSPRAPTEAFWAEGLGDGPLDGQVAAVIDVADRCFFVAGLEAADCVKGTRYRLRLRLGDRWVDCAAECIRTDETVRAGAAFRLADDDKRALELLEDALRPPRGLGAGW